MMLYHHVSHVLKQFVDSNRVEKCVQLFNGASHESYVLTFTNVGIVRRLARKLCFHIVNRVELKDALHENLVCISLALGNSAQPQMKVRLKQT